MENNITYCTLLADINLLIRYLLLYIIVTNYLSVCHSWDVSLQPYLKYLSVALCINYLSLWNMQKVQMKGFKLRSCLSTLFQSRLTKTKNTHRFSCLSSSNSLNSEHLKLVLCLTYQDKYWLTLYCISHRGLIQLPRSVVSLTTVISHQWDCMYSTIISLRGN